MGFLPLETPSSLTSIRFITSVLETLCGRKNVRKFRNDIAWIERRNGWVGFRWVHVSGAFGQPIEFVRLRNDLEFRMPKSFWPLDYPTLPKFELTVHSSEIDRLFVEELVRFVSLLADGVEVPRWDIFRDPAFPRHSWSEKALANLERHRPARTK